MLPKIKLNVNFAVLVSIFLLTTNLCHGTELELKEKLKAEKIRIEGNRTYFGEAYREQRNGFTTVHLKGEPYQIGYQHGILLKNEIVYAINALDNELRQWITEYAGIEATDSLLKMFKDMIYNQSTSKMLKFIPEEYIQEMKGIADGAGVKYKEVLLMNAGYDALENLTKLYCSALAVTPPATINGTIFHGRNLDWDPPDLIAEQNILFFIQPTDGIPFVSVAPAPFICVLTAMNLQGVSVTINVSLSNEPQVEGMPTFIMLRKLVQHAATLQDAVKLVQETPRTVGNNILVSDGKTNDAALMECSSSRCEIRKPQDGLLWATNNFEHPEMIKRQYPMNIYGTNNTGGRYEQLGKLLLEKSSKLDLPTLVEIFRNRYNWETGTIDSFCPQSTCNHKTAQSVIFAPATRQFLIANPVPVPACDGEFSPFDLNQEFGGKTSVQALKTIAENPYRKTPDYASYQHFQNAKKLIAENKQDEALKELTAAAELAPDSASLHRQIGQILCNHLKKYDLAIQYSQKALKLAEQHATERFPYATIYYFLGKSYLGNGEYEKAITALEKVFDYKIDQDRDVWTHTRIGQCYDMLNQHEKAKPHYEKALGARDKTASTAARNYIDTPFNPSRNQLETRSEDSYVMNSI